MAGERVFEGLPASVSPITGDLPAAKSGQVHLSTKIGHETKKIRHKN